MKDMDGMNLDEVIERLDRMREEIAETRKRNRDAIALQIARNILSSQNKDYSEYEDNII